MAQRLKGSEPLRIGTANLDWATASAPSAYTALLDRHRAHVWILTETAGCIIATDLANSVHSPVRPRDDTKKWSSTSFWVSILSRWKLTQIPVEADPTRVVCARVDPPGFAPLLIYGTVLPWSTDGLYRDWSSKQEAILRQLAELARLQVQHPDAHLIVAGDFNQFMRPQRTLRTLQRTLEDGLANLGLTCVTASPAVQQECPAHIIDHIAAPTELALRFRFSRAWDPHPSLSDHGGIVVEAAA
jgi:hypothetical protein